MNKKLLLTSLFFVFFSAHKIYADFCESCCLDSVQTLYCPVIADKNAEKCSESCDCCDLTTHNITAVNETRQKCCLKDEKAYWDGDSAECCTGQTYKMTDTDYGCCPKGKELPTNCSVMGPDCKCTKCDEENYTLKDGECIENEAEVPEECSYLNCDNGYCILEYGPSRSLQEGAELCRSCGKGAVSNSDLKEICGSYVHSKYKNGGFLVPTDETFVHEDGSKACYYMLIGDEIFPDDVCSLHPEECPAEGTVICKDK